jgi:hypothetical protein
MTLPHSNAIFAAFAATLLLGFAPATATAQEEVTVQGEILDLTCYLHKGSKGRRHRACAEMCAEKGLPVGVLTDKGEVFLLIEDHDNPDPYAAAVKLAGRDAVLEGKKYSKGSVTAIMVTDAKAP